MDPETSQSAAAGPPGERPAKVQVLAAQLDTSRAIFTERLQGLTDDEYFWEPVPGAWNLRPAGQVRTSRARGKGALLQEFESPEPKPAPMRTIAWLLSHLIEMQLGRHDHTLGAHSLSERDIQWPATADAAIAALEAADGRWRSVFDLVPAGEFDQVGRSSFPQGLDPRLPLVDILWWMNREYIHHTAEIALLRDLYLWTHRR